MDLNISNLKETFPSIEPKELNAFIKYQIKFSLTLNNLKCINPDCNNNKKWGSTKSGPAYTCYNIVCKTKMKEQVNKDKAQLAKKTYLIKTGYENPGQNPDIKLKKINSSLQKYGTISPNSNPEIKARQKEAIFKKYGCHISQHESVKQKARKNSLQKYGTPYKTQSHLLNFENWDNRQYWINNFITKENNFDYIKCMEYFNCNETNSHRQIKKLEIDYKPICRTSFKELILTEVLNNLNIHNIVTNSRTIIGPLELDIYLPDHNLAIEYNGAYWHQDSKKPADYHQSKSIACLSKGIRLLHIFEGYNDYNLEETLKEFLNYKADKETGVFDLSTGCYPLVSNYKIEEPELINIMGFNIYNAGKIHIK